MQLTDLTGKRIALVTPENINLDPRLLKSVTALADGGADVSIITLLENNLAKTFPDHRAKLIMVEPKVYKPFTPSASSNRIARVLWNVLLYNPSHWLFTRFAVSQETILKEKILEGNYDLVCFINYNTLELQSWYQRKTGKPNIYETYEYFPTFFQNRFQGFEKFSREEADALLELEKTVMMNANASIAVAETISEKYSEVYGVPEANVIHNVCPADPITPTLPHKPLQFYFQSNLRENYGIEEMLEAFGLIRDSSFHFTMQGLEFSVGFIDRIESLAKEWGIEDKITILSPCPYNEVIETANAYDVGLCALPINLDGGQFEENSYFTLPNKFFVYAAAGLVECMGRYPSIVRLAGDVDMFQWFEIGNIQSMAAAFQTLIGDEERVRKLKEGAHRWSYEYCFSTEAEKMRKIYLSAMAA